MNTVSTYTLKPEHIIRLEKNYNAFNEWEKTFYTDIKRKNFSITSPKQWGIIKNLLNKIPKYSSPVDKTVLKPKPKPRTGYKFTDKRYKPGVDVGIGSHLNITLPLNSYPSTPKIEPVFESKLKPISKKLARQIRKNVWRNTK
jgi:hypothetical protein